MLKHAAQNEARMGPGNPFNSVDDVQQQVLVIIHILHQNFELKIRCLPGNDQTLHHVGDSANMSLEVIKPLRGVLVHREGAAQVTC